MVRPRESEAACQLPALVEREARTTGRDRVADHMERDAARGRSSARAVSEIAVSAMTRASASIFVSSPVSVERTAAPPSRHPRTHDEVIDLPPAAANRARSGPSAALWVRPPATSGAEVTIVTSWPLSARWTAVPMPRQSLTSSRTTTRSPGTAVPSSTSWIENTSAPSTPGSRSTSGSARWNPDRAGLDPVATMTSSADSIVTQSAVASTSRRTSTPSVSRRRVNQSSRSVIWPRDGWRPASRNCPPSTGPRSRSVTVCPRSAATRAASNPAGPPPTTRTRRGCGAASNRSPSHSHSRPADGLTRQEIQ